MNKETEKLLKINETIITSEQCKEHRTLRNDERTLLMNNIKIKEYIQHLEQKESILDKVTDKLKEKIELIEDVIYLCKTDGKIAKYKIEQLEEEKGDLQEILNIIEGGNNGK